MAALAYLLPPITGLFALLKGATERTRAHGLQAVLLGVLWPGSLYLVGPLSSGAAAVDFFIWAALWLVLLGSTALGADLLVPPLRERVRRERRNTSDTT